LQIGNNISALRAQLGLSQKELSDRLGVSKATVSLWESEKKYPSRKNFEKLLSVFKLKPTDLFEPQLTDYFTLQHQLPFQPTVLFIKEGLELHVQMEKLSKEDLVSLKKAVPLLKVIFQE
jgi:transcriptional regulator with XRE-family HTH domain